MQKLSITFLASLGLMAFLCLSFSGNYYPGFNNEESRMSMGDTIYSGIRIPKTNWSNSMGCTFQDTMCVSLSEDNMLHAKLIVRVTDPNIANYPPIHFFYAFQGQATPATIGYTGAVTSVSPVVFEDGTDGWEASFPFTFDMDYVCDHIFNDPVLHNMHFFFQVEYVLVTPIDGGYTIYPVGDHPDLFVPDVFYIPSNGYAEPVLVKKEICCHNETYVCTDTADVPYAHINNQNDGIVNSKESKGAVELDEFDQNDFDVSIFPNPFFGEVSVKIENLELDRKLSLKVYDLLGKEMTFRNNVRGLENGNVKLKTEGWPPGLYYFQFSTADHSSVVKMIKQ